MIGGISATGLVLAAIWAWNVRNVWVALIGAGAIGGICTAFGLP